MPAEDLTTQAADAARSLTVAMGSDAWPVARAGIGELFATHDPASHGDILAQLDANAALIARIDDVARASRLLAELWLLEFARLLDRAPAAAGALAGWTTVVSARLQAPGQAWNQTNIARDHGIVNAVLHGDQHTYLMDSPPPSEPVSP